MGGWDDDHEDIIKEISLINGKQFTNFREMYFNVECSTAPIRWGEHHPWAAQAQEALIQLLTGRIKGGSL